MMIESLLTTVGNRHPVSSSSAVNKLPFTINNCRLGLSEDLDFVLDYNSGVKYLLEVEELRERGFGPHPELGNPKPLSVVYLNALMYKNPFLPDEILIDADKAPSVYIKYFSGENNLLNVKSHEVIWIFPKGGISNDSVPGYFYIPCFPDYAISTTGIIVRVSDLSVVSPDLDNIRMVTLTDGDGNKQTVMIAHLMVMAFGLYDRRLNSEVCFYDGDDTNFEYTNLYTELTEDASLSVRITDTDSDNVHNY